MSACSRISSVRFLRNICGGKVATDMSHRLRFSFKLDFFLLLLLVGVLVSSCVNSQEEPVQIPKVVDEEPGDQSYASDAATLTVLLASSDLSVGENRIVFGLMSKSGHRIDDAAVSVSTHFLTDADSSGSPFQMEKAVYQKWPTGASGVYIVTLNFDRHGEWGLGVVVEDVQGVRSASVRLQVAENSMTPKIGEMSPRSINKTVQDVGDLRRLTTDPSPDPELYTLTVDQAYDEEIPFVVVFSTPGYCSTSICGPQLEVIKDLKDRYSGSVNFIHIEIYDNPHDIEGDLGNAVLSPILEDWGLPSEPWTFIVDRNGIITGKFESYTTDGELSGYLEQLIE